MINPLRSEAEAFRFVIGALVYFGAIAAATVANKWAGVAVFVLLTAGVFVWWARARRDEAPIRTAPRPSGANERRILVIANETVGGEMLRRMILSKAEGADEQVLVVVPALNSPLRHWASDEDNARAAAAAVQQQLGAAEEGNRLPALVGDRRVPDLRRAAAVDADRLTDERPLGRGPEEVRLQLDRREPSRALGKRRDAAVARRGVGE